MLPWTLVQWNRVTYSVFFFFTFLYLKYIYIPICISIGWEIRKILQVGWVTGSAITFPEFGKYTIRGGVDIESLMVILHGLKQYKLLFI